MINKNFSFELKLIRWDVGDEIEIGEGSQGDMLLS